MPYLVDSNLLLRLAQPGLAMYPPALAALDRLRQEGHPAMLVHGMTHLLTFNVDDFRRYAEITVLHSAQVTAG